MILLESSSKVIETFDHLSCLPLATVQGLLKAVQVSDTWIQEKFKGNTSVVHCFYSVQSAAPPQSQHLFKRCFNSGSSEGHVFQVCPSVPFFRRKMSFGSKQIQILHICFTSPFFMKKLASWMEESLQWLVSCCCWRISKFWAAWLQVSAARQSPPARSFLENINNLKMIH